MPVLYINNVEWLVIVVKYCRCISDTHRMPYWQDIYMLLRNIEYKSRLMLFKLF